MTATLPSDSVRITTPRLEPRPDAPERWLVYDEMVSFEAAAQAVLRARDRDGAHEDVVVSRLDTLAFGSSDRETMELAQAPFAGRPVRGAMRLRAQAFAQLCARIGAPAQYIRTLPTKLQIATVNWGLAREKSGALPRLAGPDLRAILGPRYAVFDDPAVLDRRARGRDDDGAHYARGRRRSEPRSASAVRTRLDRARRRDVSR